MNDINLKLDENIKTAWEQLRSAAKSGHENITAAQTALSRVSHLVNLKNQQTSLEKTIAASIAGDTASDSAIEELGRALATSSRGKRQTVRPTEMRIGTFRKQIHYANEIPFTVANWLLEQGKVLPTFPNFVHPSNTGFAKSAKTKQLVSGQFIEIGDNQEILIQKARKLLDACRFQAIKIEVIFEDGNTVKA